jgi:hypothetical protein
VAVPFSASFGLSVFWFSVVFESYCEGDCLVDPHAYRASHTAVTILHRSNELDLHAHLESLEKLCAFAINDGRLSPFHEDLFLNQVLPRTTRVLLGRVYIYEDFEIPMVMQFFQTVMKVVIVTLAEVDTVLCTGSLDSLFRLFDENRQFYSYDVPLPERRRLAAAAAAEDDGFDMNEVFALPVADAPPLLIDNINFFGRMGGFDALVKRMQAFQSDWQADVDGSHDVFLSELHSLLLPVMNVFDLLSRQVKQSLVDTVSAAAKAGALL